MLAAKAVAYAVAQCTSIWGVYVIASSDVVNGAIIAGVFGLLNTALNARLIRRLARVEYTTAAARRAARQGVHELHSLAEQAKNGPE